MSDPMSESYSPIISDYGYKIGRFHSATIGITLNSSEEDSNKLRHETSFTNKATLFRSHKDGARIGCTFITNEAIEYIYKKHKEFLESINYTEHQSGE